MTTVDVVDNLSLEHSENPYHLQIMQQRRGIAYPGKNDSSDITV